MAQTIIPLPGGGGGTPHVDDDVRFFDPYDNSLVASFSAEDFASLSALPANPAHDGLTSQGWNWTLSDAKAQVAWGGKLDIGQNYATTDGATRVYVSMATPLAIRIYIGCNGTVEIDWGDGTTPTTLTGTNYASMGTDHTYATAGDYVLKISAASGDYRIIGNSSGSYIFSYAQSSLNNRYLALSCVRRVEVGTSAGIGNYAFAYLRNCRSVTVPSGCQFTGTNVFYYTGIETFCYPSGVTAIGDSALEESSIMIASFPKSVASIGIRLMRNAHSMRRYSLPKDLASLGSATNIQAYSLQEFPIPGGISSLPENFAGSTNLSKIAIPSNITDIGASAFSSCSFLSDVSLPSALTSIGSSAFSSCPALPGIELPASLTSIGSSAFGSCYSLIFIKFLGSTPPTVGSNAFQNLNTKCRIYVPAGSLAAYTGTANMPSSSSYTYVEY